MIGILLITHGTYGEALIQNACHVFGRRPENLAQLGLSSNDDPQDLQPLAERLAGLVDSGSGVLVLTDICGASPANLATVLRRPGKIEVVAGVNLPMLLRAINYRKEPLPVLIDKALGGGREGIVPIG